MLFDSAILNLKSIIRGLCSGRFLNFCVYAGRKNLVFRAKYTDCNTEQQLDTALMDLKEEFKKEIKNALYPHIEPYSTGMLKVSDLHSIYWEQSGNPDGHVSDFFIVPSYMLKCIQLYLYIYLNFITFY